MSAKNKAKKLAAIIATLKKFKAKQKPKQPSK